MSNISFGGNPKQAVAAAGGLIALIASAPAWAIGLGAVALIGVGAYAINEAKKDKEKSK